MTISVSDILIIGTSGIIILSTVIMIVLSILNKKRFLEVCHLYEKEFGSIPLAAAVLKDADLVGFTAGYSTKISFIIHPLIYGKKSAYSKNDDAAFIRSLPANIRYWFIAEFLCSLVGFIALVIGGICLWVDK
ncbi:hypothetical protein AC791_11005 [Klebsiella sp. RIT-PI-d]|uniref:hypothetical protein n=1 Tax=Klebsiella sp. RIT-PI-d TaxID=1681196 RepID=UPI000676854C|nr:hypothetical protein [Klebsiella sp. RIT-PI-d]KNC09188.1 hypothetical protein AC791_11005 [Klebsiella sp. RIT-PI-d]